MLPSLFFLFILFIKCDESNGIRIVLDFMNDLRDCSHSRMHFRIKLPKRKTPRTLNAVLNKILEETHAAFWHESRQHDHTHYMWRLVRKSKGAAMPCSLGLNSLMERGGTGEINLLKSIFKNDLKKPFLECFIPSKKDPWACLKRLIVNNIDNPVEKEMSLAAHHFLELAVDVAKRGRQILLHFSQMCLDREEHSLQSIRKWDRITTVPKILYLTFILHARSIIAQLSDNVDDAVKASKAQMELEQLIDTELPVSMSREVKRQEISNGSITIVEDKKGQAYKVKEVRLLFVKQAQYKYDYRPALYLEDCNLLVSVNENFIKGGSDFPDKLIDKIINNLTTGSLKMDQNPDLFNFDC